MMRGLPLRVLIAAFYVAGSYAVAYAKTVSMTLSDGTTHKFVFRHGFPEPAKNDWIDMTVAGGYIRYNKAQPLETPWFWMFGFKVKTDNIKSVAVYDMTNGPEKLIMQADVSPDEQNNWKGESPPVQLSDPSMGWLCRTTGELFIFKVIVTNGAGETRLLYQPSLVPHQFKAEIRKIIGRELCG